MEFCFFRYGFKDNVALGLYRHIRDTSVEFSKTCSLAHRQLITVAVDCAIYFVNLVIFWYVYILFESIRLGGAKIDMAELRHFTFDRFWHKRHRSHGYANKKHDRQKHAKTYIHYILLFAITQRTSVYYDAVTLEFDAERIFDIIYGF